MNDKDSELLARLASRETDALAEIYDRHASSVYGYALLVTRRPRDARRVLERAFVALARAPERIPALGNLRVPLLAATRPLAWNERTRLRRWRWTLRRASFALDESAPEAVRLEADRAGEERAEEIVLQAAEGIGVRELLGSPASPAAAKAMWKPPPRSLRPLVLMKAADAVRPTRRYFRWMILWSIFSASLLVAVASESAAPRLPDVPYSPPPGKLDKALREELKSRRHLYDLLEGFRAEPEGKR